MEDSYQEFHHLKRVIDKHLIGIKLDIYERHPLICLCVVLYYPVNCLRYILKHQIKIKLIFFRCGKKTVFQRNNIRMIEKAHCLQLAILISFILKDLLDSNSFSSLKALSLQNKVIKATNYYTSTSKRCKYILVRFIIISFFYHPLSPRKITLLQMFKICNYLKYNTEGSLPNCTLCHVTYCLSRKNKLQKQA